jgi:hypothetical protein
VHVRTLLEALDRPSTLRALSRKTGYSIEKVLYTILEARSTGNPIAARSRMDEPTYYERQP